MREIAQQNPQGDSKLFYSWGAINQPFHPANSASLNHALGWYPDKAFKLFLKDEVFREMQDTIILPNDTSYLSFQPLEFRGKIDSLHEQYLKLWDFGNGTTSTESYPTVLYSASGEYLVKLEYTDLAELKHWIFQTFVILDTSKFGGARIVGQNMDSGMGIRGFPNPSEGKYNIVWEEHGPSHIRITDIPGNILFEIENKNSELSLDL